jgi:hypothetical protein
MVFANEAGILLSEYKRYDFDTNGGINRKLSEDIVIGV